MRAALDHVRGIDRQAYRERCRLRVAATDAPIDRDDPDNSPLLDAVFDEIEALRHEIGFSWFDLSVEADIHPTTLRHAIKGYRRRKQRRGLYVKTLERVLAACNVSFSEFAQRVDARLDSG